MKHSRKEPSEHLAARIAFGVVIFLLTFFAMSFLTGQTTAAAAPPAICS